MDANARTELERYFYGSNAELSEILGRDVVQLWHRYYFGK